MEKVDKDYVQSWIKQGHSYRLISHKLIHCYQNIRQGLSGRSVRFCDKHNIKKLSSNEIDEVVSDAVEEVKQLFFRNISKLIIGWCGIWT